MTRHKTGEGLRGVDGLDQGENGIGDIVCLEIFHRFDFILQWSV